MDNYMKIKKRLMQISETAADGIIRRCMPMEDEISESEARRLYGDKWVRKLKKDGRAHWHRKGTMTAYSRAELDRLRQEESEPPKLMFKSRG